MVRKKLQGCVEDPVFCIPMSKKSRFELYLIRDHQIELLPLATQILEESIQLTFGNHKGEAVQLTLGAKLLPLQLVTAKGYLMEHHVYTGATSDLQRANVLVLVFLPLWKMFHSCSCHDVQACH